MAIGNFITCNDELIGGTCDTPVSTLEPVISSDKYTGLLCSKLVSACVRVFGAEETFDVKGPARRR